MILFYNLLTIKYYRRFKIKNFFAHYLPNFWMTEKSYAGKDLFALSKI